jgi:hypothetical protein
MREEFTVVLIISLISPSANLCDKCAIFLLIPFLPSFPSALQLRVSFGLLNNQPPFLLYSEADCLVSEQFSFYGVRLLASRPTPNQED